MRVLFIGEIENKPSNGAQQLNLRNFELLRLAFGKEAVDHFQVKCTSKFATFYNSFFGHLLGSSRRICKQVLMKIGEDNITHVFLSTSKFGKLVMSIKRNYPNVVLYVFYHNIELQYMQEEIKTRNSWKNQYFFQLIRVNELKSSQYADKVILLNTRDSDLLETYYHRKADLILPMSVPDILTSREISLYRDQGSLKLLFVGSAFFANVEGVEWFIKEVYPKLKDARLTIVGKGMDRMSFSCTEVNVEGYVEDLSRYYLESDIVIAPIFSGGGMKTKTAEALMFGAAIVGTTEAFVGYTVDPRCVGALANTPQEFIDSIEQLNRNRHQMLECKIASRAYFERELSLVALVGKLRKFVC